VVADWKHLMNVSVLCILNLTNPRSEVNMTNEIISVVLNLLSLYLWCVVTRMETQTFSVDPDTMTVPIWFIARL